MSKRWNVEEAIDAFDALFPEVLGPEPKSEFIVVSVGAFINRQRIQTGGILDPYPVDPIGESFPQWDEEVARNAAAILADYGG
jgi:hypothetical protein